MISKAIRYVDEHPISEIRLLYTNFFIGLFIVLAQGGGLLATYFHEPEKLEGILNHEIISLPLAIGIITSSVAVIIWDKKIKPVLQFHALALCFEGVHTLIWAINILVNGIPEGNFGLGIGLMSFFVAYSAYLLRRVVLYKYIHQIFLVNYLYVIAFIIAFSIEISIFTIIFPDQFLTISIDSFLDIYWLISVIMIVAASIIYYLIVLPTLAKHGKDWIPAIFYSRHCRQISEYRKICEQNGLTSIFWKYLYAFPYVAGGMLIGWILLVLRY